ncbi:MAG: alpha/beta fold hydrolase [Alphaproteobacteria bacterium]|nr:alpha/beta fold hydrolase [Alphaproteobacteria bacterium]
MPRRQTPSTPRQGPRPLPLHCVTQASTLLSSTVALPTSKGAWPHWKPHLAQAAEELAASLAGIDPDRFADAVAAETRRRFERFIDGVLAYRGHPWRRCLPEPPTVWTEGSSRLLDYGGANQGAPVLVVPSLINRAYVLDLTERRSLMRHLAGRGFRPWLLDWGRPGEAERAFGLDEYVGGRLLRAMAAMRDSTGGRPVLVGYCMGGLLALAAAALAPKAARALVMLATPWDFHAAQPAQARLIAGLERDWRPAIDEAGGLPVDVLQALFAGVDPTSVGRKFRSFLDLDPKSAKARLFVAVEDWLNDGIPLVAGVANECLFDWYGRNVTASGAWRVAGQPVRPQAIRQPTLVMVPTRDRIVPPASALALARALPRAHWRRLATGHIGMVAGSRARTDVYGTLARWVGRLPPD